MNKISLRMLIRTFPHLSGSRIHPTYRMSIPAHIVLFRESLVMRMPRARNRSTATIMNASATRNGKEMDKPAGIARSPIPVRRNGPNGRSGRVVRRHAAEERKLATESATSAARTIRNA